MADGVVNRFLRAAIQRDFYLFSEVALFSLAAAVDRQKGMLSRMMAQFLYGGDEAESIQNSGIQRVRQVPNLLDHRSDILPCG